MSGFWLVVCVILGWLCALLLVGCVLYVWLVVCCIFGWLCVVFFVGCAFGFWLCFIHRWSRVFVWLVVCFIG